ncbi:hypothetical protein [Kineosporia babensis]|uniref:Uncharacterized protein n=1 Tax=Kineosporia babensis TaxID=499548 RepID=A0A9X1NIP6_9ACTN|nr:hypothetical protein [Kineosporia babensis]MCD5314299.1 hypothetical protein [Kineosporia babensis]
MTSTTSSPESARSDTRQPFWRKPLRLTLAALATAVVGGSGSASMYLLTTDLDTDGNQPALLALLVVPALVLLPVLLRQLHDHEVIDSGVSTRASAALIGLGFAPLALAPLWSFLNNGNATIASDLVTVYVGLGLAGSVVGLVAAVVTLTVLALVLWRLRAAGRAADDVTAASVALAIGALVTGAVFSIGFFEDLTGNPVWFLLPALAAMSFGGSCACVGVRWAFRQR